MFLSQVDLSCLSTIMGTLLKFLNLFQKFECATNSVCSGSSLIYSKSDILNNNIKNIRESSPHCHLNSLKLPNLCLLAIGGKKQKERKKGEGEGRGKKGMLFSLKELEFDCLEEMGKKGDCFVGLTTVKHFNILFLSSLPCIWEETKWWFKRESWERTRIFNLEGPKYE